MFLFSPTGRSGVLQRIMIRRIKRQEILKFCGRVVRELGISLAGLAMRLGISVPGVGCSVDGPVKPKANALQTLATK